MSPLIIREHDKKLIWPEDLNEAGQSYQKLENITDDAGFKHEVILEDIGEEPRQPGGCKLKTAPVRPVVAARPAEYVCSEDLFY
ncbi:hypothetical protein ABEM51_25590 [Escherichia coli]